MAMLAASGYDVGSLQNWVSGERKALAEAAERKAVEEAARNRVGPIGRIPISGDGPSDPNWMTVAPDSNSQSGYRIVDGGSEYPNSISLAYANYEYTGNDKELMPVVNFIKRADGNEFAIMTLALERRAANDDEFRYNLGLAMSGLSATGLSEFGKNTVTKISKVGKQVKKVVNKVNPKGLKVGNKIPNKKLKAPPSKRGNAPIGSDDYPVELHHRGQKPDSLLDEMTRTDHRLGDNYKKNHPNTGQNPSNIDRKQWKKEQKDYWNKEWDDGRFEGF